ncbi:MAG: hypothetical protein ACXV6L_08300 [Halobacteriota archaeon]
MFNDHIAAILAQTPLSPRLSLEVRAPCYENEPYPTSAIQKGPVLVHESHDLSGEGVGLGVPVVKFGRHVFFPGYARVTAQRDHRHCAWTVNYALNLEERITLKSGRTIKSDKLHELKERFAGVHRAVPLSRGLIEYVNDMLRRTYGICTTFTQTHSVGTVPVCYVIDREGKLSVSVNTSDVIQNGCTELILLNEHDAQHFDCYRDSTGLALTGHRIGAWQQTNADHVTLIDSRHRIALGMHNVPQAAMFRGRELVPGRLSWAGIAYVSSPPLVSFKYDIRIGEYA